MGIRFLTCAGCDPSGGLARWVLENPEGAINIAAVLLVAADLIAGGPTGEGNAPTAFLKGIQRSFAVGRQGERIAESFIRSKPGVEIISKTQTAITKNGEKRVFNFLVRDKKTGRLYNIEVRTDGGRVTASQIRKDSDIANTGGVLKGDRAGDLKGTNQKIKTLDMKVNSSKGCVESCSSRGGGAAPGGLGNKNLGSGGWLSRFFGSLFGKK